MTSGATPKFFMDYLAMGKLDVEVAKQVIKGIIEACKVNNIALIGGETAEMPGFYRPGEYDLVGFIVGFVSKHEIIDGRTIAPGDVVIGFPSSGLHTNGYSLVRKLLEEKNIQLDKYFPEIQSTIGEELLRPHRSYKNELESVKSFVKGIAHITGGGFLGNIPRILPKNVDCIIRIGSWRVPWIFNFIKSEGKVDELEMYRVFNMGIGMIIVVSQQHIDKILQSIPKAVVIGEIVRGTGKILLDKNFRC